MKNTRSKKSLDTVSLTYALNPELPRLAMTNTVGVRELPERLDAARRGVHISEEVEKRVEDLVWSCFIGDATQVCPME
jgi:hypothetical protein